MRELDRWLARLPANSHLLISNDDGHLCRTLLAQEMVVSACCDTLDAAIRTSVAAGLPVRAATVLHCRSVVPFAGACLCDETAPDAATLGHLATQLTPGAALLCAHLPSYWNTTHWRRDGALLIRL